MLFAKIILIKLLSIPQGHKDKAYTYRIRLFGGSSFLVSGVAHIVVVVSDDGGVLDLSWDDDGACCWDSESFEDFEFQVGCPSNVGVVL